MENPKFKIGDSVFYVYRRSLFKNGLDTERLEAEAGIGSTHIEKIIFRNGELLYDLCCQKGVCEQDIFTDYDDALRAFMIEAREIEEGQKAIR